ncbi:MAG: phospho-sugar mutase [Clostridiales bacterium]
MEYLKAYNKWKLLDNKTAEELEAIKDDAEIYDRFYRDISFGTGGMRGLMGAGSNRINSYTIARATRGFCEYLLAKHGGAAKLKGLIIAYDNRNLSAELAKTAADIATNCGFKAYCFSKLMPTPILSFGVGYLHCAGGIMITASHNTKEYNGFKAYDEFGCQLIPQEAQKVYKYIEDIEDVAQISLQGDCSLLTILDKNILEAYYGEVLTQQRYLGSKKIKIVYTPLHGTGNEPVRQVLSRAGFKDVNVVQSQELPNGNFPTVKSPNPEEIEALSLGIEYAKSINADIVMGTDPDCDRLGIAVKHHGEYVVLSGHQVGALVIDYLVTAGNLDKNPVIIKTIVTNELGAKIAEKHGVPVLNTLTGFKFIGEQLVEFGKSGKYNFLFGYEESCGYLLGTHCADKDGVVAAMIIAEMAAVHNHAGFSLVDKLMSLYDDYGYYCDDLTSFIFEGSEGMKKITSIMRQIRTEVWAVVSKVDKVFDYATGVDNLPQAEVIKVILEDGSWWAVRPSGTEPKIKFYYSIKGENKKVAEEKLIGLKKYLKHWLNIRPSENS